MSPTEAVVVYAILYAFLSTTSLIYLWKKGASRKIQIGAFLGITVAFVARVLQKVGVIPTFDGLLKFLPLVVLYLLGMGLGAPIFYYATRSLRGFALYGSAMAIIFFFPYVEGLSDTARSTLDFVWWVLIIGLLLSSGVVSYRDYLKWKASED